MVDNNFADIEKRDLEAHVGLCAERYKNLDDKLTNLETRTSNIEKMIGDVKEHLFKNENQRSKQYLIVAGYLIIGLLSIVIGLAMYNFERIDQNYDNLQKNSQAQGKTSPPETHGSKKN